MLLDAIYRGGPQNLRSHEHALIPHERYDAVVVARVHMFRRECATLLRVSTWLRPDGVIIIMAGKPAGSTDNCSLL